MSTVEEFLNEAFRGQAPSAIVAKTTAAFFALYVAHQVLQNGQISRRVHDAKWSVVRVLAAPIIRKKVAEAAASVHFPAEATERQTEQLPLKGLTPKEIFALCESFHKTLDVDFSSGKLSGAVYHGGKDHTELMNQVMDLFQWSNPLHVDCFGATRKMEAEIVAMVLHMYNGYRRIGTCGCLTSGGTESIGMAMKSYRDWAKATKGITTPSVVMPISAHPAFDKACSFYGIQLIKAPLGPDMRVDTAALERLIRHDTVAIVGSAPCFPHGVYDPISTLSEIAFTRGIGLHVDCCLGSFINPFLEKAGFEDPYVDFRNRGVTSISCDTHKYGFSPKGTSVVLYGSKELRNFHFFATADWPGGVYASPGASGSKAGNVIAGTWAAMMNIGEEGYIASCKAIVEARTKMTNAVRSKPYLFLHGEPKGSVFGFGSNEIDIYELSDGFKARGWMLNSLQFPAGLQFSVTLMQSEEGVAERWVADLDELATALYEKAEAKRKANGGKRLRVGADGGTLYGSQQRVADRSIIRDIMTSYLNDYYATDHPARAAAKKKKAAQ